MKKLLSLLALASLLFATPAFAASAVPFQPVDNSTVSITVSATSQAVQLGGAVGRVPVRVANTGTATVWLRAGCSGVVAANTNIPIPAGDVEVLAFDNHACGVNQPLYVAAIAAGATGVIYFTRGY